MTAERQQLSPLFEAVGCICIADKRILLLKRHSDKSYPGTWGIPTGKLLPGESRARAIVREMYEETGILVSLDNLYLVDTYHIVNEEMSFLYTVYSCRFEGKPKITISPHEHVAYNWFTYEDIFGLQLIPNLATCLKDAKPKLSLPICQPMLFPEVERLPARSPPAVLEAAVKSCLPIRTTGALGAAENNKSWIASFGPPASGKTTTLKAMAEARPSFSLVQNRSILMPNSRLNHYLTEAFEHQDQSFFFRFQMEVLHMRFVQAWAAPHAALVDESIFSPLAYSRGLLRLGWLQDHEYQTFFGHYLTYVDLLPPPQAIYYCHCPVNVLLHRIRRRGRRIEQFYSREYIECLHAAFAEVATELSSRTSVIPVDTGHLAVKDIVRLYAPPE